MTEKHTHHYSPLIQVGTSSQALETLGLVIMAILDSSADNETRRAALEALSQGVQVTGTTISNCMLNAGSPGAPTK